MQFLYALVFDNPLLDIIIRGGLEFMVPLVAMSVIALAVVIDRVMALATLWFVDHRTLLGNVLDLLEEGHVEEAALHCTQLRGPVPAVMLAGLQTYLKYKRINASYEHLTGAMQKSMEDYAQHAMAGVEKRLMVLSTIGASAPLIGMTGTVVGMITAFDELSKGGVGGEAVASGISMALITTAAGLIVALIAVIPYNYFMSASDRVALDVEEATTELLDFVSTTVEVAAHGQAAAAAHIPTTSAVIDARAHIPQPQARAQQAPAPVPAKPAPAQAEAVPPPQSTDEPVKKVVRKKIRKKPRRRPDSD